MSNRTVQQVKALITADLSVVEKAHLVEWLGADLRQALLTASMVQRQESPTAEPEVKPQHGHNGVATLDESAPQHEIPWEEQAWTEQELRELMHPDPKTGAEIAAMIESGEVDTSVWAAMDIPDAVEWVNNLRRQEWLGRGLELHD